jgi:hypothetical protein
MIAARSVQTPFGTPLLYAVAQMPSLSGAAPATSDRSFTVKVAAEAIFGIGRMTISASISGFETLPTTSKSDSQRYLHHNILAR